MVCRQGGDVIVTAFRPSEPACPQCGRPDVVPMMSGYPAPETQEPAHRGKAALGPCISPPPGERMNRACPLADISGSIVHESSRSRHPQAFPSTGRLERESAPGDPLRAATPSPYESRLPGRGCRSSCSAGKAWARRCCSTWAKSRSNVAATTWSGASSTGTKRPFSSTEGSARTAPRLDRYRVGGHGV